VASCNCCAYTYHIYRRPKWKGSISGVDSTASGRDVPRGYKHSNSVTPLTKEFSETNQGHILHSRGDLRDSACAKLIYSSSRFSAILRICLGECNSQTNGSAVDCTRGQPICAVHPWNTYSRLRAGVEVDIMYAGESDRVQAKQPGIWRRPGGRRRRSVIEQSTTRSGRGDINRERQIKSVEFTDNRYEHNSVRGRKNESGKSSTSSFDAAATNYRYYYTRQVYRPLSRYQYQQLLH
jgi:hypothetical protein